MEGIILEIPAPVYSWPCLSPPTPLPPNLCLWIGLEGHTSEYNCRKTLPDSDCWQSRRANTSSWEDCCLVTKSCPTFLLSPWTAAQQAPLSIGFPRKTTGVGCHFLLQGIFLTQGSNLCFLSLLHCRWILYHWATREAFIIVIFCNFSMFEYLEDKKL